MDESTVNTADVDIVDYILHITNIFETDNVEEYKYLHNKYKFNIDKSCELPHIIESEEELYMCKYHYNHETKLRLLVRIPQIHVAVHFNSINIFKYMMSIPGINVNTADQYINQVLFTCINYNCLNILEILLSHPDIDVNIIDTDNLTPLYYAVFRGYYDVVKLLSESACICIDR